MPGLPDTPKPLDPRPFGPDKPQEIFLFQDQLTNIKFEIEKILEWFQGNKIPQLDNKFINEFNSLIVGKDLPVKIPLKKSISLEEEEMKFSPAQSFYIKTLPQLNYVALKGEPGKTLLAIELIRQFPQTTKYYFYVLINRWLDM